MRLGIKVVPNASRDGIAGWLGDDLKIRVQAPPEDGRANKRVCELLAAHLGLAKNAVTVVAGHANQRKTLAVEGLTADEMRRRLGSKSF
jgi:uncharacterized protein (TIGR00251 family)